MQSRRQTLRSLLGAAAGGASLIVLSSSLRARSALAAEQFEVTLSDKEWKARLTSDQYAVLRKHGTEREGSSALLNEKRTGVFACAGCRLPVFDSSAKYESGTGWPSFTQPIAGAVATSPDNTLFFSRTEVHCRRCGGHLGHVFDDGPPPLKLRYCMNGVAMIFMPGQA